MSKVLSRDVLSSALDPFFSLKHGRKKSDVRGHFKRPPGAHLWAIESSESKQSVGKNTCFTGSGWVLLLGLS